MLDTPYMYNGGHHIEVPSPLKFQFLWMEGGGGGKEGGMGGWGGEEENLH